MDEAASHLTRLLRRSIRLVTKHVDHVAVAFSGGIDSAVTATLAKRAGKSIELISVGLTNSPEMREVEKYAKQLDLPITTETYSDDSMEEYVRRIVWLIEDHSLMKVSVAVPLHWAATRAQKSGHTLMLCGQGSDELYGGYYKYARILDEQGREALRAALYRSVLDAAAVNYERDDQATSPFGVTLRTPFADHDLIRFSLTIPSEYKVKQGNDLVRKWVLRAAAKKLQVPEEMIWRRKKAIQHGTGVEDAIRRLAKTGGISVASYLANIYTHMAREPSMP
jgi:asparagine synthase (glutamine-hydrolysing)